MFQQILPVNAIRNISRTMRRICMLILGLIGLNENWLKLSFVTVAILGRWLRTKKDAFQGCSQLLQIQTFSSQFFPHIVVFVYTVSIYYRSRVRRFTQYKSMICFGNLSSFWHLFVTFLLVFSWLAISYLGTWSCQAESCAHGIAGYLIGREVRKANRTM